MDATRAGCEAAGTGHPHPDSIDYYLSERGIVSGSFVALRGGRPISVETGESVAVKLRSRGEFSWSPEFLTTTFRPGEDSFEVGVALPAEVVHGSGVAARFRISGWDHVRYAAVGYRGSDGTFVHLKAGHPGQGAWETLAWSSDDLSFLITHGFERPRDGSIGDVRVWISGTPSREGGTVDVAWVGAWSETPGPRLTLIDDADRQRAWLDDAVAYVRTSNVFYREQAARALGGDGYPILDDLVLPWPTDAVDPLGWNETTTFEHRYHGQVGTIALLARYDETNDEALLMMARSWVERWLATYGSTTTEDLRYVWYDHTVPERLIALDLLYLHCARAGTEREALDQVLTAIEQHARLLESLSFYAYHQPDRHHNHALYQDLALLMTAELFEGAQVERWRDTATTRVQAQFAKLLVREGGHVVSVENSMGYHLLTTELLQRFRGWFPPGSLSTEVAEDLLGMNRFRELWRYQDGRLPALGDTLRRSAELRRGHPDRAESLPAPVPSPDTLTILRRTGYAVARGGDDVGGYLVGMVAPSLSRTHKHADHLSLIVFHDGVEWLGDPSFYSHEYDEPVPAYLRGPWGHSQLVVPDSVYDLTPGLARLDGYEDGDSWEIWGSHRAYAGATVYRRVKGSFGHLDLQVEDRATLAPHQDGVLVFRLGEAVSAELDGSTVVLRHPDSIRSVELTVPDGEPRLHTGWTGDPATSSVIGTSYRTVVDSTSVVVPLDGRDRLRWSLTSRGSSRSPRG